MDRAIILAAGMGSRLVQGRDYPKPLQPVAHVPLLVRILRTLRGEGVHEAVIVTGHLAEELRRGLAAAGDLDIALTFVHNDAFATTKNGVSVLAAREHIQGDVFLTMGDHLFSPSLPRSLRKKDLPPGASALGVDFDVPRCFDLDDATKVRVEGDRIAAIGKELTRYKAIDTGVFRITSELVTELAELHRVHGDCSLSEGVAALLKRGLFFACDVGSSRWIDIDTPEALAHAEEMLQAHGDALIDR
ncbi:N/A [soil metagenome]